MPTPTPAQMRVLRALEDGLPLVARDAHAHFVSISITPVVKFSTFQALMRRGWVETGPTEWLDVVNAVVQRVTLTAAGREALRGEDGP